MMRIIGFCFASLLILFTLNGKAQGSALVTTPTGELIRLQVLSKFPVLKIQALRDALQTHLPQIKGLKERSIASGVYTYEGVFNGEPETLKNSLQAFTFETLTVKSVEVDGRTIDVNF